MKFLTRDEILSASDIRIEVVETPEWGEGTGVYVRGLTGYERDRFEQEGFELVDGEMRARDGSNAYARFAARVVCDASGKRLFSDDDIPMLGARSAAPLMRIWRVGQKLSGLTREERETLGKNSKQASGDSGLS